MNPWYSVFDIVSRSATDTHSRDRLAVSFADQRQTFTQLHERAQRLSHGLGAAGIQRGDRVAVLMGNSPAWIESMFAITLAGAVCVPVNVLLRGSAVDNILRDSGAKMLLVDALAEKALTELTQLPDRVLVVGEVVTPAGVNRLIYEDVIAKGLARRPEVPPSLIDPAMIYYTSGTTGQPKGAVHTHSGILWNTYHQIADAHLGPDDVYLLVPSLSWSAGFHDVTLALFWLGGHVHVLPTGQMTIDKIVTAIETIGATGVLLVPTLLKQLVSSPDHLARLRRTRLRRIYTGGEPVPGPVIDAVHDALPTTRVEQLYGFSEFPLMTTILSADDSTKNSHKTGRPTSIVTLAVRTPEGEITQRGEGEVLVRSPATMVGYHNRPELNATVFADGWFNTGDSGKLDDEGFMTLTGRVKDMIITGGMNVYPRDIEDLLYKLDGIREVAIVGVPDDKWGEAIVAIVVPQAPGSITEERITNACAEQLSSFMRPRTILMRTEPVPRTVTGKVLKRELRPWAEAEMKKST